MVFEQRPEDSEEEATQPSGQRHWEGQRPGWATCWACCMTRKEAGPARARGALERVVGHEQGVREARTLDLALSWEAIGAVEWRHGLI